MVQYHIYPGGKRRILTFSYDDGHENDARLIELFNKYGMKGTFHLNSAKFREMSDKELAGYRKRYEGHEISCHTVSHGWPSGMPPASLVGELLEDRRVLERLAGYPVVGLSYPSGSYNDEVCRTAAACGIVYSRTVESNRRFALPEDFLRWSPTCHHKEALSLCDRFLADLDSQWVSPLFYIWGHSHELREEEHWIYMEELCSRLAGQDKIWYATNLEIYTYMTAQRQLRVSVDEHVFYNPTAVDLWVERDKRDIICIPAGQTVQA